MDDHQAMAAVRARLGFSMALSSEKISEDNDAALEALDLLRHRAARTPEAEVGEGEVSRES